MQSLILNSSNSWMSYILPQLIIPALSLFVAGYALSLSTKKMKVFINASADQEPVKNYDWSITTTLANAGHVPFTITKICAPTGEIINSIPKGKFPVFVDVGKVEIVSLEFEYSIKNTTVIAYDQRGKRHKIKIKKQPILVFPDKLSEIWQKKEFRSIGHLKEFIRNRIL